MHTLIFVSLTPLVLNIDLDLTHLDFQITCFKISKSESGLLSKKSEENLGNRGTL